MATTTGVSMTFVAEDGSKFTRSLNNMLYTAITVENTPAFANGYKGIVAGALTTVKHIQTTEVDITEG